MRVELPEKGRWRANRRPIGCVSRWSSDEPDGCRCEVNLDDYLGEEVGQGRRGRGDRLTVHSKRLNARRKRMCERSPWVLGDLGGQKDLQGMRRDDLA